MLTTLLAFAMFFQYFDREPPSVPATAPNPEYPLHVHILNTHWNWMGRYGVHGYGRANLVSPTLKGIDYTYSCEEPFLHNQDAAEFYQAKWKKQDEEMTLLLQRVGSSKTEKCDVKVALHDAPYGRAAASTIAPPQPASQPPQSSPTTPIAQPH